MLFACVPAMSVHAAERPAVLPDTMAQRVLACTSCHARKDVNDPYFPRISGKPAGYLYNQMLNFRDGRRQVPIMSYMVERLSEPYMREIAAHFAAEHLPSPPIQKSGASAAVLERGRVLVMQGDPALRVPACIACHGEQLTGAVPAIPGLLGLQRDYVNAQLGAWRNRTRRAHAPDCMAQIASRLGMPDVTAISSWLALQPVPAGVPPAADVARPLPLKCGSAP